MVEEEGGVEAFGVVVRSSMRRFVQAVNSTSSVCVRSMDALAFLVISTIRAVDTIEG